MRRTLLIVLGGILVLLAIAGAGLYWFLSGDGIRRALEQQASAWIGEPVQIGSVRAGFFPRVSIHLSDVRIGEPARLTLAETDLSTGLRALLGRRIEDATVEISRSRVEMPLPFALPASNGPSPASASGESPAIRIVSITAIALRDVVLVSRGQEITVTMESTLNGDQLIVRRFDASTGAMTLDASGEVQLAPRVDARLRVTANQLVLDDLLALATAFSPPAPPGTVAAAADSSARPAPASRAEQAPPMRIAARVSAETARAGGVDIRQFATDLEVVGESIALSPLTFQLFGGRYQGSLHATMGDRIAATIRARLMDLDVAELAAFGNAAGTVTGRLSGAATVTGEGTNLESALATARGSGTTTITDGSIRGLNLIRTVVLFFGRPDPGAEAGDDSFESLDASFSLANQVFQADALSLHSDDVDLVGTGSLTIPTKMLEGRLDLSLSESLSKQAGTDLYRYTREGNRIVLPGTIGGTLEAPRLSIDAAAAVRRGLRNEVQRRLEGLLDKFGKQP